MTREEALTEIKERVFVTEYVNSSYVDCISIEALRIAIKALEEPQWIPIKWHDCTDADREKYGFSDDIVTVFDCEMPDDDQAILVTTSHGYVNQDVCYIDDGFSLDSGYDWIDDITAWMPLPAPYQGEGDSNDRQM